MVVEVVKGTCAVIAVQVLLKPELSPVAETCLRADAGIRVPVLNFNMLDGSKSGKKHDKQLTFIVRVGGSYFLWKRSK